MYVYYGAVIRVIENVVEAKLCHINLPLLTRTPHF